MKRQGSKLVYSSYIKDMPFLFLEMRKAAKLIVEGTGINSLVEASVQQNIFQLDKERRRLKLAQRIVMRLSILTAEQILTLAIAPEETSKIVAFYAIIKTDLLFFEFMKEVYAERQHIGQVDISDADIISFLHSKEAIAKWTDNNFTRVKNTYKAILCEAGLAIRDNGALKIQRLIIDDSLKETFSNCDEYMIVMGLGA